MRPVEYRPDLMFADGDTGYWNALEIQRSIDQRKQWTWPAMVALQNHRRKCAGDLIVITHSRAVASWVRKTSVAHGQLGTTLQCTPALLYVDRNVRTRLLRMKSPGALVVAAWAMHERVNAEATRVATRAVMGLVARLSRAKPPLRSPERELNLECVRVILNVLKQPVVQRIIEAMKTDKNEKSVSIVDQFYAEIEAVGEARGVAQGRAEGKAAGKAEGKAEGLREAVRSVLLARGFKVTQRSRQRIESCADLHTLQRWHKRAVTAVKIADVFRE
jgi:hypothetical protein